MNFIKALWELFGGGVDVVARAQQRAEAAGKEAEAAQEAVEARTADVNGAARAFEVDPHEDNGRAVLRAQEARELAEMRARTLAERARAAAATLAITETAASLENTRRAELLAIKLEAEAVAEHDATVRAAVEALERCLAAEQEAAVCVEGARAACEAAREEVNDASAKLAALTPDPDGLADEDATHQRNVQKALGGLASFEALLGRVANQRALLTASQRVIHAIGDERLKVEVTRQGLAAERTGRPDMAAQPSFVVFFRDDALFAARRESAAFQGYPAAVRERLTQEHRSRMLDVLKPYTRTGATDLPAERVFEVYTTQPLAVAERVLEADVEALKGQRGDQARREAEQAERKGGPVARTASGLIDHLGLFRPTPPQEPEPQPTKGSDYGC